MLKPNIPIMLARPIYSRTVTKYGTYCFASCPTISLIMSCNFVTANSTKDCFLLILWTFISCVSQSVNKIKTAIIIQVTTVDSFISSPLKTGMVKTVLHWSSSVITSERFPVKSLPFYLLIFHYTLIIVY